MLRKNTSPTSGPNIIKMSQFLGTQKFPVLSTVEAYWEGLRAGRLLPRRSEIDPRGIENALEFAFILERIAPGVARMRIAGSHLTDLMGMEVRGMPASTFFTPAARARFGDTLEAVFDGPATATLDLVAERSIGKPALDARMLLLPLQSDLGDVSRVLGCLVTKGNVGRSPRRFEIQGETMRPLMMGHSFANDATNSVDQQAPKTKSPVSPLLSTPKPKFGETKPEFHTTRKSKRITLHKNPRDYLRLVTSDT